MVNCAKCGYLGVRHPDTYELVGPGESQRETGIPANTGNRPMELSLFSNMFGCLTILAFPVTVGGTRVMATGTERN